MELYHGTAVHNVESILKHGLLAGLNNRTSFMIRSGHERCIFATPNKKEAYQYARSRDWHAATVALVCIEEPIAAGFRPLATCPALWAGFEDDDGSWFTEGGIDLKHISRIEIYSAECPRSLTLDIEPLEVMLFHKQ